MWLGDCLALLGDATRARERYQAILASPRASEVERATARRELERLPATGLRGLWGRIGGHARLLWHHAVFYSFPTLPETYHATVGHIHFDLGHFRKAIAHFEKSEAARSASETRLGAYNLWYLGYAYLNTGQYPQARQCFERALRHRPDDADLKEALDWLDRQPSRPSTAR